MQQPRVNSQATLLLVQALCKPDQANKTMATEQPANIHVVALHTASELPQQRPTRESEK